MTKIMLFFIRFLPKKKFVEFCGSDIRSLELLCDDVPYYDFNNFSESFRKFMGVKANSLKTQTRFKRAGFYPLPSYPELTQYIDLNIFEEYELIARSVDLKRLEPKEHKKNPRPLIVHAPSNPEIKGTSYIGEAANRLVEEGLADYRLITKMEHSEAMELLSNADIVVDQIVAGDYGVLAIESMALEKPVVCFIRPYIESYYTKHFENFPIVNANIHNIYEVLRDLVVKPEKCREIGAKSRKFANMYHDPFKNAKNMKRIYTEKQN